jgi:tryptophan synthase alpha chain
VFPQDEKAFIPFVTAGHPDLETSREIILSLARTGSAVIEIGIPFSDPVADGPIIQRSSFAALKHGYEISDYIDLVRQVRSETDVGLIFMTYLNPVLQYGLERLDREASAAGLDGVLISDLTPEEYLLLSRRREMSNPDSQGLEADDEEHGGLFQQLDTVFLAAPTSSNTRIELICKVSTGFVYLIARTGVTGKQTEIDQTLSLAVDRIREYTDLPVAVGFGIQSKQDVEKVWQYADAAVVGSAIVRFIEAHQGATDLPTKLASFVKDQLLPVG